jgi:hypothetical protein
VPDDTPMSHRGTRAEPDAALQGSDPAQTTEVRRRPDALEELEPGPQTGTAPPVRPALPAGYEYVGELGRGGMGVVYLARDEKGQTVAVKTLARLDPARLDYLKREFTALADLRHENLVTIYRQVADGTNWFCVMEYVEGRHLLPSLRDQPAAGDDPTTPIGPPNPARLRSAFAQLAAGIHALHGANMLHRDIKSSNVKVDRAGRVKLLDFGLVAEIDRTRDRASGPVGTVDHMSPEQLDNRPLTPASDWYSFGVILYAALGGQVPFSGSIPEIMRQKERVPPRPSELVPGVPPDLDALCTELLRPDPAERPAGADVLRRLGAAPPPVRTAPGEHPFLLGREGHLAALHGAAAAVRRTCRPVVVEVHGPSGAGKTALVERFLRDLRDAGDTVVLTGRSFEQSSVPYKALDGLIDALCRHLRRLTREQVAAVLPIHPGDLARLFPVLGRLEAVAEALVPALPDDPHEARRRAFAALRELFARIAVRRPLVLFADDLQWGDRESAALLTELVRPPDAPPLLFLASYRRRDADASPFVTALRGVPAERVEVAVDPLTETDALHLATALLAAQGNPLLSSDGALAARFAGVIARESAGNPFLIHELVEFQSTAPESTTPPTIETVVRTRLARVGPEPRRLLEVVVLAAGPLEVESAFRAANIPPERQSAALDLLLVGRAVRTAGGGDAPRTVEPFHDRVRESVAADLGAGVRTLHHRRLAVVLTTAGGTAPEVLAHHFARAGEAVRAAEFYARAGEQSARALAFERAAEQYRLALDGCPESDPRRKGWLLAWGGALANAARGPEAAAAFAAAADLCTGTEALFCRQRVAEQLFRCGRIEEGMGALRAVLAGAGIALPGTGRSTQRSLFWMRLRLGLRGLRFRAVPADAVPAEDRLRTEICRWAAGAIRLSDVLLGTWFHSLGLLLGLRSGDVYAVAQALAREAHMAPLFGRPSPARLERVQQLGLEIAARIENPDDRAFTVATFDLYRVIGLALLGDPARAVASAPKADAALRACADPGATYQRSSLRMFEALALSFLGELARCRAVFEEGSRNLVEGGNLHAAVTFPLVCRAHLLHLADDRPAGARRLVSDAIGMWSQSGVSQQHLWGWWSEIDVLLYERRGLDARTLCLGWWDRAYRPALLLVELTRAHLVWTRARCAVARAAEPGTTPAERRGLLREAKGFARTLMRQRVPLFAPPLGWLIRAAVAHLEGDRATALCDLERAEDQFTRSGLVLHGAAAAHQRGRLAGGPTGAELGARAHDAFRARGVRDPARFAEVYAPGFGG